MEVKASHLIREFGRKCYNAEAALLIGSGPSIAAGLPSFPGMIRVCAEKHLDLKITKHDNLPQIAQYCENAVGKGELAASIMRQLDQAVELQACHRALARINLQRVYTTNFDNLLERMYEEANIPYVVIRKDEDLANLPPNHMQVVKIHGDVSDLVVTTRGFAEFFEARGALANELSAEMLKKPFLFIGHSYSDPNIQEIVRRAGQLAGSGKHRHYIIVKRETRSGERQRQRLWEEDLMRQGLGCVFINHYSELTEILAGIALKSRGPTVFVTGSHRDYENDLARAVGAELAAAEGIVLVTSQSEGIGITVLTSFMANGLLYGPRVKAFPNPFQKGHPPEFAASAEFLRVRVPLLRSTQVVVVFDGSHGTRTEVQGARQLGCKIVPVPQDPNGFARQILQDPEIQAVLRRCDPDYLNKAVHAAHITAKDVVRCVQRIIRS